MSSEPRETIVYILNGDSRCEACKEKFWKGAFLCLTGGKALCLKCAGLDDLEYLPSGNTAVTRRATKYSSRSVVVVKKSRARKRAERQGILAEPEAIRRAEVESEADAVDRAAKREKAAEYRDRTDVAYVDAFVEAIQVFYPRCPLKDARWIAAHACEKYSGRVGRSAAAKKFDAAAIRNAVVAHIRHIYTEYDKLLLRGLNRPEARDMVRERIGTLVRRWEPAEQAGMRQDTQQEEAEES